MRYLDSKKQIPTKPKTKAEKLREQFEALKRACGCI